MKTTLSVLVENRSGVLSRVSGMFARRGFNIESLSVGPTENERFSRMTIVVDGEQHSLEQVTKQLHKLINVIKISELTESDSVERELVLMKVHAPAERRAELLGLAEVFRANIVDVTKDTVTIEVTGTADKLHAIEALCADHGIVEMARTGLIALPRGGREQS